MPWQHADLDSLGLDEAACRAAVQYRNRRGEWSSAGRAVAAVLCDARPPWSWLGRIARVPGIAWVVDRVYAWVARNRHRFPGTARCDLS